MSNRSKCLGNAEGQGLPDGKMKNNSATIDPLQHLHRPLTRSCLGSSGLVKAAGEVELKMPLEVSTFSSPHAVLLRWEAFALL